MPAPAAGLEVAESPIPACGEQQECQTKNTSQKYEMLQRIIDQQPFCAKVKTQTGGNAEQQERNSGTELVVYRVLCYAGFDDRKCIVTWLPLTSV